MKIPKRIPFMTTRIIILIAIIIPTTIFSQDADILFKQAIRYYDKPNNKLALEYFDKAISATEEDLPRAHLYKGIILTKQKKHESALQEFDLIDTASFEKNKEKIDYCYYSGKANYAIGKFEKSYELTKKGITHSEYFKEMDRFIMLRSYLYFNGYLNDKIALFFGETLDKARSQEDTIKYSLAFANFSSKQRDFDSIEKIRNIILNYEDNKAVNYFTLAYILYHNKNFIDYCEICDDVYFKKIGWQEAELFNEIRDEDSPFNKLYYNYCGYPARLFRVKEGNEEFVRFWYTIQQHVIDKNIDEIIKFTRFPFKSFFLESGSKSEFIKLFNRRISKIDLPEAYLETISNFKMEKIDSPNQKSKLMESNVVLFNSGNYLVDREPKKYYVILLPASSKATEDLQLYATNNDEKNKPVIEIYHQLFFLEDGDDFQFAAYSLGGSKIMMVSEIFKEYD